MTALGLNSVEDIPDRMTPTKRAIDVLMEIEKSNVTRMDALFTWESGAVLSFKCDIGREDWIALLDRVWRNGK